MMAPIVIGLTGRPGSGKDSCALALEPLGFRAGAFADALREEVSLAWGVDVRMLTDRQTKETPLPAFAAGMCQVPEFVHWAAQHQIDLCAPRSPRWVLQRWGTEFRRADDPDYWVRILQRWAGRRIGIGLGRLVITDVRMPNEAALVRHLGGRMVRVHRPDLPVMAADTAGHSSEAHDSLAVDGVIHNDGDLDQLRDEVMRVVGSWVPGVAATSQESAQ